MSARPISVRKLKEILRCKYQGKLTHRQIALSLSISASTVSYYVNRAALICTSNSGHFTKHCSLIQNSLG